MPFYTIARENYTPLTNNSDLCLTAVTPQIDRIIEVMISGTATSSAVNRQGIARASALGVTPAAVTQAKQNPQSGNATATTATTFTTTPTFVAQNNIQLGLNAFGGVIRWVAAPGEELYVFGAGATGNQQAALTATNGVGGGTQSAHLVFEEL